MKRERYLLIYRLGSLGDTVIALPAFNYIRSCYPDHKIILLTNVPGDRRAAPSSLVLGEGIFFDEMIDYPVATRNPLILLKLIRKLRSYRFEFVINLTAFRTKKSSRRDKLFFSLLSANKLVGFDNQWIAKERLTGTVLEREYRCIAARLESIGQVDVESPESWQLRFTDSELSEGRAAIQEVLGPKKLICACIGTKMQSKDWGIDNWIELFKRLKHLNHEYALVFVGAKDEYANSEACGEAWQGQRINLAGSISPRISAVVLSQCVAFIGHDSGPMHLAAAVQTPCVAIFSGRNLPEQWYPWGKQHSIIHHLPDCAGCTLETCIVRNKECLKSITVENVQQRVEKLLKRVSLPEDSCSVNNK